MGMNNILGNISELIKGYLNLRVDQYKLKVVEDLSLVSNNALVALVATMIGAVILQLSGFAAAFFIGELIGSTVLGFLIMIFLFIFILVFIYAKRHSIFLNNMIRMYKKIFF